MTSFIIDSHAERPVEPSWSSPECPFCAIISGKAQACKIYEDEKVIVVLDILPLRPGHTLVIPKVHTPNLSDLQPEYAAAVGVTVSRVAKALSEALDNSGLNVVCNQQYAQAVPHVHYHIVPAPKFGREVKTSTARVPPPDRKAMHQLEYESRQELDESEGRELANQIKSKI